MCSPGRLRRFVPLWFIAMALGTALPINAVGAASLQVFVNCSSTAGGQTGSRLSPFRDIATAVATGRALGASYSDIKITVLPGTCSVSSPIVIDFPVRVQGSSVLNFDVEGWPLGTVQAGTDSRVEATAALGANPVFVVEPAAGASTLNGVSIRNLSIVGSPSGTSGSPAETLRIRDTQNLEVTDLVITAHAGKERVSPSAGIDLAGSSGYVKKSCVTGMAACGICIAGGTAGSPATVNVIQNRSVAHGAGALLLAGTGVTGGGTLTVQVNNNDFADNATGNLDFGIRVMAIGSRDLELPNSAHVAAYVNGNRLANNRYQLIVDAGFPPRNNGPVPATSCADEFPYSAEMSVQLNNNTVVNTTITQSPALVATSRAQVRLAPNNPNSKLVLWQYLSGSSVSILDPELSLTSAAPPFPFRDDAPLNDPFVNPTDGGSCVADLTPEHLANLVSYNGFALTGSNF